MQQLCGGVALRVPKMRHILIYSIALGISISWFINSGFSVLYAVLFGVCATYLPFYFNGCERKDGFIWPYFQRLSFWRTIVANYHQGTVNVETKLDNTQQYIFCCFPHGACSINHFLTMTDSCGMLSKLYTGDRRDLVASILFLFPVIREILLFLGCVDASSITAKYNLKKGRSLFIYVGGEKEQLMTTPGESKIYLRNRKGFAKLALTSGAHLVPMYAFGENETYSICKRFIGIQLWLQKKFQLGIPLAWGLWYCPFLPNPVPLTVEIGKPIKVKAKPEESISQQDIDSLHEAFTKEIRRLFNRTKINHRGYENAQLEIL